MKENKLNFELFKDQFHESWHVKIQPAIESEWMYDIFQELKTRKSKNIVTYPTGESKQLFSAFMYPLNSITCIWAGMSPYNTAINGKQIADGKAFSCSNTEVIQPSLAILYNSIENEFEEEMYKNPDLSYLAQQGIFLLNVSLTTQAFKADSDIKLWEPFIKYLFTEVFNTFTALPIVLFGEHARKGVEPYLFPMSQPYKSVKHPAYYSYRKESMPSEGIFTWMNKTIVDALGIVYKIEWDSRKHQVLIDSIPF